MDSFELSTILFKTVLLSKYLFHFLPLSTRNVYNYLWRHYGASTTKLFSELLRARVEICKLNLAILYIRTCQNENLVPNFVRFRVAIPRLADSKVMRQCQNSILQDELKFKRHLLRETTKHMARLDQELKEAVLHMIYVRLMSISTETVNKNLVKIQDSHKGKLDTLRAKSSSYTPQRQPDLDPVKNLSSQVILFQRPNIMLYLMD